jgi:GTP cyclohydrolase I
VIESQHFCMICRGVRKEQSSVITCALSGTLRDATARAEFLRLIDARI